jgi:hypothetical protein
MESPHSWSVLIRKSSGACQWQPPESVTLLRKVYPNASPHTNPPLSTTFVHSGWENLPFVFVDSVASGYGDAFWCNDKTVAQSRLSRVLT